MREYVVQPHEAGQRLDKYLGRYLPGAGVSFFYKMLRKKNIRLNGKKAEGNERLKENDCISVYFSEETFEKLGKPADKKPGIPKTQIRPDILYEDEHVLLINKPAGILSQKAKPTDVSMNDIMLSYLASKPEYDAEAFARYTPSICNRLDRNTSGILACGKTLPGLRELNRLFHDRSLGKYYLTVVKGKVAGKEKINGYLLKDEKANKVRILEREAEGADEIATEYEPLEVGEYSTLLKVHLITGKSHQIRAHLASIGHPIAGDGKYGDAKMNKYYRDHYKLDSQLLHCYQLVFGEESGALASLSGKVITAPVPSKMEMILKGEFAGWQPGIPEVSEARH